ncbi:hypothetical protein J7E63_02145 [Bacillus sp. ISL-75]|nr:hypothetical protein [Bacillus sp. ISL-75]
MHQVLSPSKYELWLGIATDSKAYFYWTFKMSSITKLSRKLNPPIFSLLLEGLPHKMAHIESMVHF